jgi:hypothetical protein
MPQSVRVWHAVRLSRTHSNGDAAVEANAPYLINGITISAKSR